MLIRSRAPLRLGFAGGGTDVAPYCNLYGGCVLNATIDRYAYATIRLMDEPCVTFKATDQQRESTEQLAARLELNDDLKLLKAAYNEMIGTYNDGKPIALELVTFCDAPAGSGLGSSSTLVVAIVRAFVELLNLPLDDYAIAKLAFKIERVDCALQGGRQDQYSATFGGFNFMEFREGERSLVNPLRVKPWIVSELEASLLLFYTGVSRESARIIADQSSGVLEGRADAVALMHEIKEEAFTMKECLLKGDFGGLEQSLNRGWSSKKRSAKTVSNPLIEVIYEAALGAGARAGKVSGAGGGGFMMFLVPPQKRMDVVRALRRYEGQLNNCHFTNAGAQAWRV